MISETDDFNNLCEGATVTMSGGNYEYSAVDNYIDANYLCTNPNTCAWVNVVGSYATLTVDLGSVM